MRRLKELEHLLSLLNERMFTPIEDAISMTWSKAHPDQRHQMLEGPHADWQKVSSETVWGEPQSYFWFAGRAVIPEQLAGKRVYMMIEAQFGRTMGRSDPQCLVRINGDVVQGADFNHREVLLSESAKAGESFDVMIEAGTIEDRRQIGFECRLTVHDLLAEAVYYDLRAPLDVAKFLPETDHRRDAILNAVTNGLDAIDFRQGNPDRFANSLIKAQQIAAHIYEIEDTDAAPKITVTGHTHIDVAWLWRIRETRQKMARSMSTVLRLMEEYPDYRFMYNQGVLLDYLEQDYPDIFSRIKDRHAEGKFEIEGALWLEPDANITNGESLVRHILRGVRYHEDKFDVRPKIVWLPDTFGYSAAMPQIMELAGLDVFVTHKMSWNDTNRMPAETFFWEGIDGTRIPTYFLTTQPMESNSIGTSYGPDLKASHVMGTWRRYAQKQTNDDLFLVYGFGDGGGGPNREMLEHIKRMERGIPGCPRVEHGFMGPFFERLVEKMKADPNAYPAWVGELYLEFHRGTFTSVATVKRNNRKAEARLRKMEVLARLASLRAKAPYPVDELGELWDIVLLNQFHDILPGSSIGEVFEDSAQDFENFFSKADALEERLVADLAASEDAIMCNPFAHDQKGLTQIVGAEPIKLNEVASQTGARADGTVVQIVPTPKIPALGAASLSIVPSKEAATGDGGLIVSDKTVENALIRAEFDANGRLVSLYDKRKNREALKSGKAGNRLVAYRDHPAQFDAWDIDRNFEDQFWEIDDLQTVDVVEAGPYRAAIRFEWAYEGSRIVQVASLAQDAAVLEFDTFIDWQENNTLVKVEFPFDLQNSKCSAEIQFGHVSRPTHANTSWESAQYECPMHRWVDMSEQDFGVALLNDCKYGYDAKDSTLRLTLLRSPTWPWPNSDIGAHHLRYGLFVHCGLEADNVPAVAEVFNQPLEISPGTGAGEVVDLDSIATVDNPAIVVEAVKKAEDGEGTVLRLWERHGKRQSTTLLLASDLKVAALTDLLEENEKLLVVTDQAIALEFKPFEIKTILLT